jgi:hypothetical protein
MELQFLIFFLLPMAIIFPLFSLTTGKEPTIAARISTKGIDFFSVIGHKIVLSTFSF